MKIFFQNMFLKDYSKIMMLFTNILFMKDSLYKCIFHMFMKDYTNIMSLCINHVRLHKNFLFHMKQNCFFEGKNMILRTKLSQAHGMRYIHIPFKFLLDPSQELVQKNSKNRLMGWFKQLDLNQIRGGPLKKAHMIFRPLNTWFRLFKFPHNHFHKISKLVCTLWLENTLFTLSDVFSFGKYTTFLLGYFPISWVGKWQNESIISLLIALFPFLIDARHLSQ